MQHLGLEQSGGQGWGGLPRSSLPPQCLPAPPGHLSQSHPPPGSNGAGNVSAFNPFHYAIEQRSPRLSAPTAGIISFKMSKQKFHQFHQFIQFFYYKESSRSDLGPISVSVREVSQESPGNPGPGLLTTAAVNAPPPPLPPPATLTTTTTVESVTNTNTRSPTGHHQHLQGKINK